MSIKKGIFIVAAKRTAFGTYGGALKEHSVVELQAIANAAALHAGNVKPDVIDAAFCGSVMQTCTDAAYIARHAALKCKVPVHVPALTVNRLCGSGFQSIISGTQEIELGLINVALCGGSENMSQTPYTVYNARFGTKLGIDLKMEDALWAGLTDSYCKTPMAITAEKLAEKYGITRVDADAFALKSQKRWEEAHKAGRFLEEITPITSKTREGPKEFDVDEHPNPGITAEEIAKLPPAFLKDGTINAGNASGVCDGAASVIIANEDACTKHNLKPLARLVSYNSVGCEPTIMGIGPAPAIQNALSAANLKLEDMDLCEVNESFAPQYLAVEKELGLNPDKTNVDGGAIALGHPLGASGTRITAHLVHEMRRRGVKYSVGSACIGGGQGIALILENAL